MTYCTMNYSMLSTENKEQSTNILKKFIVLEGADGAGTTTQATMLLHSFQKADIPVHCSSEPTRAPIGNLIRSQLQNDNASPLTLALLFAADRSEHLSNPINGIYKLCREEVTVISDRYLFSSLVYQGMELTEEKVREINQYFPLPEHLIFIDTALEITAQRLSQRSKIERYERQILQEKIHQRYQRVLQSFQSSKMKIHYVDGSEDAETVHCKIKEYLAMPI